MRCCLQVACFTQLAGCTAVYLHSRWAAVKQLVELHVGHEQLLQAQLLLLCWWMCSHVTCMYVCKVVLSKHLGHNACLHVPYMLCAKRKLQHWARLHAEYVSVLCAKMPCQPAVRQRESSSQGCAVELHTPACVLHRTHAIAAFVWHCMCNLRVLQSCSTCVAKQCGSGGTDSSSSISAGARCADCTQADASCCESCICMCNINAFDTCAL
jgi:hypothetical protein